MRCRNDVMRSRRALASAREELIEALGDWLCGGGPPPLAVEIEALGTLAEACRKADLRYALSIANFISGVAERSRQC
jgi:hypothetical protein